MNTLEQAELGIFFRGQTDPLKKGFKEARDEAQTLQTSVTGLGGSLKSLVGAYLTVQGAQRALQLMSLGEDLEEVRAGLNNIVGNGPQNLARARAAVKGTIDDLRLMRVSVEGVQAGLNFDQVLQVLSFAEYRVGQFGENFDTVFQTLTNNLSLLNRGLPVSDRALNRMQISGKTAADALKSMADQMARAEEKGGAASNTMARFDANIKNLELQAGTFLKTVLSPLVELLNVAATTLQNRANPLAASALQIQQAAAQPLSVKRADISPEEFAQFLSTLDDDKLQAVYTTLRAQAQVYAASQMDALVNLRDQIDLEIRVAQARGQSEQEYILLLAERKAIVAQIDELNSKSADEAAAKTEKEKSALREQLELDRQLLEARINNGDATYQQFRELLDKQYADHQAFIDSDTAAFVAYLNARARLRGEDNRQREADEAEIYNSTKRFVDYTLADSSRTKLQRMADAYEIWQQTLNLENLSIEHRRQILSDMAGLEEEFTGIVAEEAQRHVDLLMNLFGNTFLQAFDDILTGSSKRFEDYLGDLGRALLRFLASQALLKFFALLAGGPLAGLFGGAVSGSAINSGSGNFDWGISSAGGFDLNRVIGNGVAAAQSLRQLSPVYSPTFQQGNVTVLPAPVQVFLDEAGLYAASKRGQRIHDRSSGT